jgi:hypothetical protein
MRRADYAWTALAMGILVYDLSSPEDELLSEAAARYEDRHPWVWRFVVFATALHLTRDISPRLDVYKLPSVARGRLRRQRV